MACFRRFVLIWYLLVLWSALLFAGPGCGRLMPFMPFGAAWGRRVGGLTDDGMAVNFHAKCS